MSASRRWLVATTCLVALFVVAQGTAFAQATRTWVSGVGDDANPCSRTAPCKTFAGAISKTAPAGEINVLDPGGFGAVTITKSITIRSDGFTAGVLVSGTNGIIISAGSTDKVVLKGLDFNGLNTGLAGIKFIAGGELHVENCDIAEFGAGGANAIDFIPNQATDSKLSVKNSRIRMNAAAGGGGINVAPAGGGKATATIEDVSLEGNKFCLLALDNSTVNVNRGSCFGSTTFGYQATANSASTLIQLSNVTVSSNNAGVKAAQTSTGVPAVQVSGSTITANATGISVTGTGQVKSLGNNLLFGNTTDGAFTSTITPH